MEKICGKQMYLIMSESLKLNKYELFNSLCEYLEVSSTKRANSIMLNNKIKYSKVIHQALSRDYRKYSIFLVNKLRPWLICSLIIKI